MTIESALQTHLSTEFAADANLAAFTVQVYPHVAPQTAVLPFVTYETQTTAPEYFLNSNQTDLTYTDITVELSVWCDTVARRALILTSIKDIMHGLRGAMGTENLDIRRATIENVSTFSESELTGTDNEIYRATVALRLIYNWS
jgi:hypothetical protein